MIFGTPALIPAAYHPFDAQEAAFVERTRTFLATTPPPLACSRRNPTGHVTASAFVLGPDRAAALLVHHAKLDKWVQPGGHVEPDDPDLPSAARREAAEETGLESLRVSGNGVFDVDVHLIPDNPAKGEPAHFHYDIRFLFVSDSDAVRICAESKAYSWRSLEELAAAGPSLARMAAKARLTTQGL